MSERKNILICPLNWGLGHTTRLWALVDEMRQKDLRFFWLVSGKTENWIRNKLKDSNYDDEIFSAPDYAMRHYGNLMGFIIQMPFFYWHLKTTENKIQRIINTHHIHGIISDHHLGAFSSAVPSILIAHQLWIPVFVKFKWLNNRINQIHTQYLNKFLAVWIPDLDGEKSLTGNLSVNPFLKNAVRIGLLSHLQCEKEEKEVSIPAFDIVGIISGPEPFRAQFAEHLFDKLKKTGKKAVILGGDFSKVSKKGASDNVTFLNISGAQMKKIILQAPCVIASGGYSTIMDLNLMAKKAILVPMPGQPEQQYLAAFLKDDPDFKFITFDQLENIPWEFFTSNAHALKNTTNNNQRKEAIQRFLNLI